MTVKQNLKIVFSLFTLLLLFVFFPETNAHAASTYSVSQLTATVSGKNVSSTTIIKASSNTTAQYAGVCARDAKGNNYDFPKKSNIKIATTGTTITASETFPNGTFSYFGCLEVNNVWYAPGATQYFTVGATTPTPTATPTPKPTATPIPTATPTLAPTTIPTPTIVISPTPSPIISAIPTPTLTITPTGVPSITPTPTPTSNPTPLGGANYAGSLVANFTGSQLAAWNDTSGYCSEFSYEVADGAVSTDASGSATLTTTGKPGSCVAIKSPTTYSSNVIEAYVYLPALSTNPNTIANWTAFWITNENTWPVDGELDAIEAEPVNGINAVSWHSGTVSKPFVASTDGFFSTKLPIESPNLTPGWHTLDIVYTKGFFAVYYDGQQYTNYTSSKVTGSALNIILDTLVTPSTSAAEQQIGGPPVNSDSTPKTFGVKYIKVWSYK